MESTYEEARGHAESALHWVLTRLTDDPRAKAVADGSSSPLPLHILLRNLLTHVEEQSESAARAVHVADLGSSLDRSLDAGALRKARAVLGFGYARALDVAQVDSTAALEGSLEGFGVPPAFEPELHARAAKALNHLLTILRSAAETLPPIQELTTAYDTHLAGGIDNREAAIWAARQRGVWQSLAKQVHDLESTALALRVTTTFDEEWRGTAPHAPLVGLPRREQQRLLLLDMLLLHEEFGLSEAEIGELWAGRDMDRASAKKAGGDVLRRARKARAEGAREK